MEAKLYAEGNMMDHTPAADVSAGQVLQIGGLAAVAMSDIASGDLGAVRIRGLVKFRKKNEILADGERLYWDEDGDPYNGTSGAGCATKDPSLGFFIGCAADQDGAVAASEWITVNLNAQSALEGDGGPELVTGGAGGVSAADLVYASAEASGEVTVLPAQATSSGKFATHICPAAITATEQGAAVKDYLLTGVNTSAGAVGDPVYLSDGTAGGWTLTKPTGTDKIQIVGQVAEAHATTGAIQFDLTGPQQIVHDHSDNSEGGQLAWDDVWSDAAHDHSTAAKGDALASATYTRQISLQKFLKNNLVTELGTAGDATNLGLVAGTHGSASPSLQGSDVGGASGSETARMLLEIPADYVAASNITLRFHAGMLTTISDTTATLDVECYETDEEAGVSADLCATDAISINSLTLADKDFTITGTDLVAGDILDIEITVAVTDSGNAGVMIPIIGAFKMLYTGRPKTS